MCLSPARVHKSFSWRNAAKEDYAQLLNNSGDREILSWRLIENTEASEKTMKRTAPSVAMVLMVLALVAVLVHPAAACTEFILKAQDGSFVIGRSLEFGWNPGYQAVVHPRGEPGRTDAPGGKPGLTWTSKYGFLAFESFGSGLDGLN
jgi:hypothetical protein